MAGTEAGAGQPPSGVPLALGPSSGKLRQALLDGARTGVPFEEQFVDSAMIAMRVKDVESSLMGVGTDALVLYAHAVSEAIEPVLAKLQLTRANDYHQAMGYMLALSPEMPPGVQATRAVIAAQELRHVLSDIPPPAGMVALWEVALHLGSFTGAVIGKSTWSYK